MSSTLIPFCSDHIPHKVQWVNDPLNNRYLHYDLPLTVEGTTRWWENAKNLQGKTRLDKTIQVNGQIVGLTGLLAITETSAETYILVDHTASGQGIASSALRAVTDQVFARGLRFCYANVEEHNIPSWRAFEKAGFHRAALLHGTREYNGRVLNEWRMVKTLYHDDLMDALKKQPRPLIIQQSERVWLLRDDLLPQGRGGVALRGEHREAALTLANFIADWSLTHFPFDGLWIVGPRPHLACSLAQGLTSRGEPTQVHLQGAETKEGQVLIHPGTDETDLYASLASTPGRHLILCAGEREKTHYL